MEVHAHTHTERKKWTHYFWEFLMLFLAVFCGFLAEYQLEHTIEHNRERQLMQSMVEDLCDDTTGIKENLSEVFSRKEFIDSILLQLSENDISEQSIRIAGKYTIPALARIPFTFTDRTSTQLKNSGGMRLIRKKNISGEIVMYWKLVDNIVTSVERYDHYRSMGRDMETKIFNLAENYLQNSGRLKASDKMTLIRKDQLLIKEYANVVAYCGVTLNPFTAQLKEQLSKATLLIGKIKKEYHLK
jgi:hypothetical protein